jgi:hypothetical protein
MGTATATAQVMLSTRLASPLPAPPEIKKGTRGKFGKGNKKLGKSVLTWSELPVATCAGMSEWCAGKALQTLKVEDASTCYAAAMTLRKNRPAIRIRQELNTAAELLPEVPKPRRDGQPRLIRWYVSGDLTARRIPQIAEFMQAGPYMTGWLYTRSWRVPELRELIEQHLQPLPNLSVFASTDVATELAPTGWRVASILGDSRYQRGVRCPEQFGAKPSCEACRFCFDPKAKNKTGGRVVTFRVH